MSLLRVVPAAASLVLVAAIVPVSPAEAQPPAGVELTLVEQRLWHSSDDELGMKLRVTNVGASTLDGFRVAIAAYERVESRSALQESFDGPSGLELSSELKDFHKSVAAGQSAVVRIDDHISTLQSLVQAMQEGVYPLVISLYDTAGELLDSLTTELIYYPKPPETPLNLVLVVPFNEIPSRDPRGLFTGTNRSPLEVAMAGSGRLSRVLRAISVNTLQARASSRLELAVAPTPRMLEELADMSDGYERVDADGYREVDARDQRARSADALLARMRSLVHADGVQALVVPYSFPDLPTTTRRARGDAFEHLSLQLSEGEHLLKEALGLRRFDERWIFPPGGRADAETLERLRGFEAKSRILLSEDSLEETRDPARGCPEEFATFSCPIRLRTTHGSATGFVADAGLQKRLDDIVSPGNDALDLQKLLAETAVIHAELPSVGDRVVQLTLPWLWDPPPGFAMRLFRGLSRAPWLESMTPNEAVNKATPRQREIARSISAAQTRPDRAYYDAVDEAARVVDSFARIGPPASLIKRLRRNVLVAQSTSWWSDPVLVARGQAFARAAKEEAQAEMSKIRIGGVDEMTLSSRSGRVLLVLTNDTRYPVKVNVHLFSPDLRVDRILTEQVRPETDSQISTQVAAPSSGIFSLQARLTTPDGLPMGEAKAISIRSTNFNEIALAITGGALSFLILFYALRAWRRRTRSSDTTAEPSTT